MKILQYIPKEQALQMNPFELWEIEECLQEYHYIKKRISPEEARIKRKDGEHLLYIQINGYGLN